VGLEEWLPSGVLLTSVEKVAGWAMLTASDPPAAAAPDPGALSARERELVTLVAQGRTNAQIAAQLYISIRTVTSHPDRIRDKTGCRRRADLTRLALTAAWSKPGPPSARFSRQPRRMWIVQPWPPSTAQKGSDDPCRTPTQACEPADKTAIAG
jgi:DNA-binding CsgD family transcriptional regulator